MPSQTHSTWINFELLYLSGHCPKFTWLSLQNGRSAISSSMTFFSEEVQFLIQKMIETDPSVTFINKDLSIALRHKETVSRLQKQESIANGELFWKHFTCTIDLLRYVDGQWILTYIQPSISPHKKDYMNMAYIMYLLCQYHIVPTQIDFIFINSQYKRQKTLNLKQLTCQRNATSKVNLLLPSVVSKIKALSKTVVSPTAPDIPFGMHCLKPSHCHFLGACFPRLATDSILSISGISKQKKVDFVKKNIISLHDVALHVTMNERHAMQVSSLLDDRIHCDQPLIRQFLDLLSFPLYFMDFEVAQFIVPPFEGLKPLHQLPFQYSIHILKDFHSEPEHISFLSSHTENPEYEFAKQLSVDIPENVSVIVFNENLEQLILRYLQHQFPSYQATLLRISKQLIDLSPLFLKNGYYHPKMNGKFSLKDIYTAISSSNTNQFESLSIKNGESANIAYKSYLYESDPQKRDVLLNQLQTYCRLDTYAMVEIIKYFYKMSKDT